MALMGLIFLLHTLANVLALWLPVWAGYAIVMGVLFLVAGILAMVGKKALASAKPVPEKAIAEVQQTLKVIKP